MGKEKPNNRTTFKLNTVSIEGQIETNKLGSPTTAPKTKQKAKLEEHKVTRTRSLPKGLVGSKSTANVKVNGLECNSLLDTGSQVTTMSQSFYRCYLSDHSIHPVTDLLEIEGANGHSVPYMGYVQVTIQFPKEFISTEPEIETLALIVPDVRSNSNTPLLIGTNTLDPLYEQFCDDMSLQTNPYCGYHQVLRTLKFRHNQSSDVQLGLVNLRNTEPNVIPAGQKVVLEAFANVDGAINEKWVLVEQPSVSSLPGGIFIDSCVITLPKDSPYKIPVVVRNETDRDICLPVRCVVAELSAVKDIIPTQNTASCYQQSTKNAYKQSCPPESSLKFDFGDSLPEKWKSHMTEKLNTFSDVFSHNDLDYGHATKVKH